MKNSHLRGSQSSAGAKHLHGCESGLQLFDDLEDTAVREHTACTLTTVLTATAALSPKVKKVS